MSDNDKVEILEILNLYGLVLDARRWDLFDRVFTDDVEAVFGPASAAWNGIDVFVQAFTDFHTLLDGHQHTMMGQVIEVDGDTAHAFSYGNWLLIRYAAEGGPTWSGTGWYDDILVRTENGWRIKRRVCRLQSWSGNPLVPPPTGDQTPDMKARPLHDYAAAGEVGFLTALSGK